MGKNELEIYFYLKDHTDLNHPIKVGDLKKELGDSKVAPVSRTINKKGLKIK